MQYLNQAITSFVLISLILFLAKAIIQGVRRGNVFLRIGPGLSRVFYHRRKQPMEYWALQGTYVIYIGVAVWLLVSYVPTIE